jgi:glutamate racemase
MKIGVFDSGLGGLTVLSSLTDMIKGAAFYYVADTLHAPYGEKSPEEIRRYSLAIADYFVTVHRIDALVVACNTATSAAISHLRKCYPELIIVGTEPGVKPAIAHTRTGRVGVLATPATLKSDKYQTLVNSHARQQEIVLIEQACPGLVEQIEAGKAEDPQTEAMLKTWLHPMREANVDTIVLGCTHYPLVGELIKKIMVHDLALIHTGDAIAKRLLTLAKEKGHMNEGESSLHLFSTSDIDPKVVSLLVRESHTLSRITLQ